MTVLALADRCAGSGCDPDEWEITFVQRGRVIDICDPATYYGGFFGDEIYRECPFCGRMLLMGSTQASRQPRRRLRPHAPIITEGIC